MGMAASQARLLTLTARIHDVEYEAQALQNAKVELSTQSDRIYEDYLEALDATTLTILKMDDAGNKSNITATFNNLCSINKVKTANGKNYAIFDSRGRLIVDDGVFERYTSFKPKTSDYNDAISFAMYAMGIEVCDNGKSIFTTEKNVYNSMQPSDLLKTYYKNCLDTLNSIGEEHIPYWTDREDIYNNNDIVTNPLIPDEDKKLYEKSLLTYRTQLYKEAGEQIYQKADKNEYYEDPEFNYSTFQYYVSLYNQIQQASGCVAISEFNNGDAHSNAANDSEWLKAMIECGEFTIAQVVTNAKTLETSFDMTSPSSDDVISYTQTTEIDKTALAKAEAEYEHGMSVINKKDERFDLELSKLEAERTALTTEYDSVKKVIEDNIDRTFGIFS